MYLYSVLHTEYSVQSHIIGAALRGGLARSPHSPDGRLAAFPRGDHSAHTTGDGGKKGEKKLAVPPVMD
jgi:hypothetical protein